MQKRNILKLPEKQKYNEKTEKTPKNKKNVQKWVKKP